MRIKSLSIKHNSGTFVRNTRKSVPALLDNELKNWKTGNFGNLVLCNSSNYDTTNT